MGLSSEIKVEAKTKSTMIKLFAEGNLQSSTKHRVQLNTTLHS